MLQEQKICSWPLISSNFLIDAPSPFKHLFDLHTFITSATFGSPRSNMTAPRWDQCLLAQNSDDTSITFNSPTAGQNFMQGFWDPNHLSTDSIRSQATLPTPWPILLAGLLISLFSALKTRFANSSNPAVRSIAMNSALGVYQFVRCLATIWGAAGVDALLWILQIWSL